MKPYDWNKNGSTIIKLLNDANNFLNKYDNINKKFDSKAISDFLMKFYKIKPYYLSYNINIKEIEAYNILLKSNLQKHSKITSNIYLSNLYDIIFKTKYHCVFTINRK